MDRLFCTVPGCCEHRANDAVNVHVGCPTRQIYYEVFELTRPCAFKTHGIESRRARCPILEPDATHSPKRKNLFGFFFRELFWTNINVVPKLYWRGSTSVPSLLIFFWNALAPWFLKLVGGLEFDPQHLDVGAYPCERAIGRNAS